MKIKRNNVILETTDVRENDVGWYLTIGKGNERFWDALSVAVSDRELSDLIDILDEWKKINSRLVKSYLGKIRKEKK